MHSRLQIQYRAERALQIIHSAQSSPYLHRGVIKGDTAHLTMCNWNMTIYGGDKASWGDKKCIFCQREIERGATLDDMELASQECSS